MSSRTAHPAGARRHLAVVPDPDAPEPVPEPEPLETQVLILRGALTVASMAIQELLSDIKRQEVGIDDVTRKNLGSMVAVMTEAFKATGGIPPKE